MTKPYSPPTLVELPAEDAIAIHRDVCVELLDRVMDRLEGLSHEKQQAGIRWSWNVLQELETEVSRW